ncbi:Uncharacterised protein [BD1-7 clade bacterium]|uniref:Cell surface protein n=1 Tax=BD1-7 clade bacterium TaxID=2029982 RepID=A0A5S9PY88_9GAMM|nr:Uncharacterised protein [BD1-7 clade bacterium]CAA0112919.1 Uncharacterised protein [BD1-7 clade bacterium]
MFSKKVLSLAVVSAISATMIACSDDDNDNKADEQSKSESTLIRIATVSNGAEVTGIELNDAGELFFNAQHPGKKDEYEDGLEPATVGYAKGMDINVVTESMPVPGEADRAKSQVAAGEYVTLAKAGDLIDGGNQVLGGIYDVNGNLLYVSNDADFNAFVSIDETNAYLYTGWEGAGIKGASSVSRLTLKKENGEWAADLSASEMLDMSSIGGSWILCFSHETNWETTLTGEEYYYLNTGLWNMPGHHDENHLPYFISGSTNKSYHIPGTMGDYLRAFPNPYEYGYQIEISDREKATPTFTKHYAMGRFSHENGVVMDDNKTVYQSDDDSGKYTSAQYNTNSGGVFFKFVADKENDLSAGTLYAAKLTQSGGPAIADASFAVDWIELGHSNNATVKSWAAEYADIDDSDYVEGENSYISDAQIMKWAESKTQRDIDGDNKIAINPFGDDRPAFLESRKAAAALGATYEWNKLEGVTADSKNLYIAVSDIGYTMSNTWGDTKWSSGEKIPAGESGDITLEDEHCGAVYRAEIGDDFDITEIAPEVIGQSVEGGCDADKIANPDNILSVADDKVLIGEDSGDHGVDMLWLYQK